MLTIPSSRSGLFCDGVTRRDFIRIGGLALGGAFLPQITQAQTASGNGSVGNAQKAVIMIFLPGGPSHQDLSLIHI